MRIGKNFWKKRGHLGAPSLPGAPGTKSIYSFPGRMRTARYAARPAVSSDRLSVLPDSCVSYRLRHKWRSGASHVLCEPLDLKAKPAALVPPLRFNPVRYHGVFPANARWRVHVVPIESDEPGSLDCPGCRAVKREGKKT